jgi:hypothetical protein
LRRRLTRADLLDQLPRRRRGNDPELSSEAVGEAAVRRQRRRAVPIVRQAADQLEMGLLGERVECDLAARQRNRPREVPRRLRASGHPLQQPRLPRTVLVASLINPVLVEVFEQFAFAELERLLKSTLGDELLELADVGPDLIGAGEGDSVAAGQQVAIGVSAQRATQSRQGAAQARACALIEHVGPEASCELPARVRAPLDRKQAQQRTRPTARRQLQRLAIHLERRRPQQLDAQHEPSLRGFTHVSRALRGAATAPWKGRSRKHNHEGRHRWPLRCNLIRRSSKASSSGSCSTSGPRCAGG